MPNLNRAFRRHGSSFIVHRSIDHGSHVGHVVLEVSPYDSSLEKKHFLAHRMSSNDSESSKWGIYCRWFARSRTPLSRDFGFWFPGARPNKWLILNRIIDLSDLRCQQISRKWETKERIALTSRARRHCLRNTIN